MAALSSALIITLEITVVLGVVLGLAVWELMQLRRDRLRRRSSRNDEPDPPAP